MAVDPARLARALSPKVVAVVGDKKASGYTWLRNMSTFSGKVYSVQLDPNDIPGIEEMGIPNFKSLLEIPDEIDWVVCAVPRQIAPRIVQDAAAKGAAGIGMFTSGFAETGEELGRQLQDKIVEVARESGLALVGPNCMGLYNAKLGVRFSADQPAGKAGRVGLISQSGTHGINTSLVAAANGILLTKGISIGNAVILDVPDYLEHFENDPETDVIALYIEGTKNGRRLREVLNRVAKKKPVVVWKGGQTSAGARATMSHTASLAAPGHIWNAIMRQANCIQVDNLDEMVDTLQVLLNTKPGTGTRAALMAQTGGQSVVLTDAFAKQGLDVPELSEASYTQLGEFFNIIGGSYRNPFDMAGTVNQNPETLDRIFDIIDADPNIDTIAMELSAVFMARRWSQQPEQLEQLIDRMVRFRDRSKKPFVVVLHPAHLEAQVAEVRPKMQERGLPVLPSFDRAARAMAKVAAYYRTAG